MVGEKEKLSRGEAIHRRRVLADERRKPPSIEQRISTLAQAEDRLSEINEIIESQKPLTSQEEISLQLETIFLKHKLGRIDLGERQSLQQRMLNTLQEEQLGVYEWLTSENGIGTTPLIRIRDKVFPPSKVDGHHTKGGF